MEHDENQENETQIDDGLSEKQAVKEELIRRISQLKSKSEIFQSKIND